MKKIFFIFFAVIIVLFTMNYSKTFAEVSVAVTELPQMKEEVKQKNNFLIWLQEQQEKEELQKRLANEVELYWDSETVELAKAIYGEAHTAKTEIEKRAIAAAVINRAIINDCSIQAVLDAPRQIQGYHKDCPVEKYSSCISLAKQEIYAWLYWEETGDESLRALPSGYIYWLGDKRCTNYFLNEYWGSGKNYNEKLEFAKAHAYKF